MATQNGGGGLRRVAATLPPPGGARVQLSPGSDFITLAQPRPDGVRARNDYIETPLRPPAEPAAAPAAKGAERKMPDTGSFGRTPPNSLPGVHGSHHLVHGSSSPSSSSSSSRASTLTPRQQRHHHHPPHHHLDHFQHRPLNQFQVPTVVKQQPASRTFSAAAASAATLKKEKDAGAAAEECGGSGSGHPAEASPSIICRRCLKCRCDACRSPKALPSAWLCDNKYQCSAETTLDYCSCMCCVKGLLYHCMKDRDLDNDVRCADRPCSCHGHRRCTRWGCVAALLPLLPCLLCYWPLKGCFKLCEMAYTECHSQGCRCGDAPPPATQQPLYAAAAKQHHLDALPSKRLLDTSAVEC